MSFLSDVLKAGISVKNESSVPLLVIASQVTPLYWGRVDPGETWNADNQMRLGKVWFTISVSVYEEENEPTIASVALTLAAITVAAPLSIASIALAPVALAVGAALAGAGASGTSRVLIGTAAEGDPGAAPGANFTSVVGTSTSGVYSNGSLITVRGEVRGSAEYHLRYVEAEEVQRQPYAGPPPKEQWEAMLRGMKAHKSGVQPVPMLGLFESRMETAMRTGDTAMMADLVKQMPHIVSHIDFLSRWTVLHAAAREGYPGIIQCILDTGKVDIHAVTAKGWHSGQETAMHIAVMNKRAQAVPILARAGADLSAKCQNGLTPLFIAAGQGGDAACTEALLRAGADPYDRTKTGKNILDIAVVLDQPSIVSVALAHITHPEVRKAAFAQALFAHAGREKVVHAFLLARAISAETAQTYLDSCSLRCTSLADQMNELELNVKLAKVDRDGCTTSIPAIPMHGTGYHRHGHRHHHHRSSGSNSSCEVVAALAVAAVVVTAVVVAADISSRAHTDSQLAIARDKLTDTMKQLVRVKRVSQMLTIFIAAETASAQAALPSFSMAASAPACELESGGTGKDAPWSAETDIVALDDVYAYMDKDELTIVCGERGLECEGMKMRDMRAALRKADACAAAEAEAEDGDEYDYMRKSELISLCDARELSTEGKASALRDRLRTADAESKEHKEGDADTESAICPVCLDAGKDTALVPCGHMLCGACADKVHTSAMPCPNCRASIERVMKVYLMASPDTEAVGTEEKRYMPSGLDCLSCICPPMSVAIKRGPCTNVWWLNVFLTLMGWVPGFVHASCIVHAPKDVAAAVLGAVAGTAGPRQVAVEGEHQLAILEHARSGSARLADK